MPAVLSTHDVVRSYGPQLSVGQRRRVALALLVAEPPDLLLDEPTNHISLTRAEELQEALGSAPGAVIAASHDRWLRRRWHGPTLALSQGQPPG